MTEPMPPRQLLVDHVRRRVEEIQAQYARGPGQQPLAAGARAVATLRRLSPAEPGDDPASWAFVWRDLPAPLLGRETPDGRLDPSWAEQAAHSALVLYAVHQQSTGSQVHRRGARPGAAFGALARARATGADEMSSSMLDHVHAAASATSHERRAYFLRTLVTLLRAETSPPIPLDYGLLADDLAGLASPRRAPQVRLAWGRDLHRRPSRPDDDPSSPDETSEPTTPGEQ